jgi:hypothetical protein
MRIFILLFFGVVFTTFGQQVGVVPKNRLSFQLMQNTPIVGVVYKRLLWQGSTKPLRLEAGLGVGWLPTFFILPQTSKSSPPISLSHDLMLIYGKRPVKLTIGYSGILMGTDRLLTNTSIYTPNPHAGVLIGGGNFFLSLDANAYIYKNRGRRIENDNILVDYVVTKAIVSPGFSFGFKF